MEAEERGEMVAIVSIDAPFKPRPTLYACDVVSKGACALHRGWSGAPAYVTSLQRRTRPPTTLLALSVSRSALCSSPHHIRTPPRLHRVYCGWCLHLSQYPVKNISRFAGMAPELTLRRSRPTEYLFRTTREPCVSLSVVFHRSDR